MRYSQIFKKPTMRYFALLLNLMLLATLSMAKIAKRVIGGEIAPPDKYRWAVSIKGDVDELKTSGACGASILKTKGNISWLLTAAHCFYPSNKKKTYNLTNPELWHARVGLMKVDFYYKKHGRGFLSNNKLISFFSKAFKKLFGSSKNDVTTGDIHIKKVIIHPDYVSTRLENDIALMKFINPLPIDQLKGVNTIELPDVSKPLKWPTVGSDCIVVGWGCTKAAGVPNTYAKLASLKVWDNDKCIDAFVAPIDLNPESEFCAGYLKKKYGLCPGDSGSGLACMHNGRWMLAGVVSAAHSKEPGQFPAIFTNVASFKSWILESINKN